MNDKNYDYEEKLKNESVTYEFESRKLDLERYKADIESRDRRLALLVQLLGILFAAFFPIVESPLPNSNEKISIVQYLSILIYSANGIQDNTTTISEPITTHTPSNSAPGVTRLYEQVQELFADEGEVLNYDITLVDHELIVGTAYALRVTGQEGETRGCVVYSIRGPGTYSIEVEYGLLRHFRNVLNEETAQMLYERERAGIVEGSSNDGMSGTCGSEELPITDVRLP